MKAEHATAFLMLAIASGAVWYLNRTRVTATPLANVVTEAAGNITPTVPVSNVGQDDDGSWAGTPYYLRANYPTDRDHYPVMPSTTVNFLPANFGPQEIANQF